MFKIGDLVQFDSSHATGIVTDIKLSPSFLPEEVLDAKVLWEDGVTFWCLEFTLVLLSSTKD